MPCIPLSERGKIESQYHRLHTRLIKRESIDGGCQMKYDEIKDKLQTGDVILFEGEYRISRLIEAVTGCDYSHCGVVLRLDGYDSPLLWEATTLSNLNDVITGDTLEGPKIVDLRERLEQYGREIVPYVKPSFAWHAIEYDRPKDIADSILNLHKEYHGIKEASDVQMTWDVIQGRYLNREVKKDSFFCSELVAITYMALGLIGKKHPYNAYVPKDFTDKNSYLKLIQGAFRNQVPIDL